MIYEIKFTKTAILNLKKLDKKIIEKIIFKIEWLSNNLDNIKPIPLKGKFIGYFKLRVGNYRIIYDIDYDKFLITIFHIGHRKEIYKK